MKTKYVFIAIASLSITTAAFAQANSQSKTSDRTSSMNAIASVELKSGPLADFYELVAQNQLPKLPQEQASTTSQISKSMPPVKMTLELAENMKAEQKTRP